MAVALLELGGVVQLQPSTSSVMVQDGRRFARVGGVVQLQPSTLSVILQDGRRIARVGGAWFDSSVNYLNARWRSLVAMVTIEYVICL